MIKFSTSFKIKFILLLLALFSLFIEYTGVTGKTSSITVLNVGQGDAILINTPHHQKVLIDGGPDGTVLQKIPLDLPFLTCKVDVVVLTHPQADHLTGLSSILKRCKTSLVIYNMQRYDSNIYEEWVRLVKEKKLSGLKVTQAFMGDRFLIDNIRFNVIWPPKGFNAADVNDESIVLLLSFNNFNALFTGDAETNSYINLVNEDLDFLKVPHHGSLDKNLEAFLQKTKPEVLAISVGKNNFGHPSDYVLGITTKKGVKVLRTDLQGDITVDIDAE